MKQINSIKIIKKKKTNSFINLYESHNETVLRELFWQVYKRSSENEWNFQSNKSATYYFQ